MAPSKRSNGCPIVFALDILGDKWTLLVLRDLIFKGKAYYQDFLEAGEGVATNVLADRLALLKKEGLIDSRPDPDNRRKIIYRPTDKALDLIPMILEMVRWSAKYDKRTSAPKEFLDEMDKDLSGLIRKLRSQFT